MSPESGRSDRHPVDNVIYGIHAVEELLANRLSSVDHVYFEKDRRSQPLFNLIRLCRKERLAYNLVPASRLDYISNTTKHQGVVATSSAKPYCSVEELRSIVSRKTSPLIVVAASVEDPGNLGSIIRSCVAFGADALLLERKNSAPLTPAAAKSSAGMIEHLCIGRPRNLEGVVKDFLSEGYVVVGTHAERGVPPAQIEMAGPTILVLGGEHRGIPPYLATLCSTFANVPLSARAQSLNVSAAAAVLLYECMRQRGFPEARGAPLDVSA